MCESGKIPNDQLSDYGLALKAQLCAVICIDYRRLGKTDDSLFVWADTELKSMVPIINERFGSPEANSNV